MAKNEQTSTDIFGIVAESKQDAPHHQGHRARLRERFLSTKNHQLPDYELLELALFAASARSDVKPLAKRLLKHFGTLEAVYQAPVHELRKVAGMGDAAICAIKVAEVAMKRMLTQTLESRPIIQSWTSLLDYCRVEMSQKNIEEFRILFLNHKNALLCDELQQSGTVDHTPVFPREVVRRALELGASAIILLHNHPGGDPNPSKADIELTEKIVTATQAVGIAVHDHLIFARHGYYSFKSHGLI